MEYGEATSEEELGIDRPEDCEVTTFMARDVSVGLYRLDEPRGEIFPPSTGEVELVGGKVICTKKRAVRAPIPIAAPSGPQLIVDRTVVSGEGVQWMAFDVEEVQGTGRTLLLRHKLQVDDGDGRYEVLLDGGSQSHRLVRLLRKAMEAI